MEKKKLAFVDYWTHQNTKSGDFLREILSEKFTIYDFWWKEKEKIPLEEISKFDYIFFFHVMFPYQIMKKLNNKKIMWAPMYDALNFRNYLSQSVFWKQMSSLGVKVLSFSDKVVESIGKEELKFLKLNYYIKPNLSNDIKDLKKINIFFWDRGRIKIDEWIKFFNKKDINEIVYYSSVDPGMKESTAFEAANDFTYNFKIIKKNEKFLSKDKYLELSNHCNVFIAPRKKEGIGITIVEAISRGMYVVGYNDSTMNEYIKDEKIGFLFNKETSNNINLKNITNNYDYRKNNAELNYNLWNINKKKILPFFDEGTKKVRKIHFYLLFFLDDLKFFFKKIFKINFYY